MSRIADVFHLRESGRLTVVGVNPDGVTDYSRFEQCTDELRTILQNSHCRVARFDFEGIPFLASGMLGLLVALRKSGIDIQVQNASPHIREVLRITRMEQLVEYYPLETSG